MDLKSILLICILITLPHIALSHSAITYIESYNGVDNRDDNQAHENEFTCLYETQSDINQSNIIVCENEEKQLYTLNTNGDTLDKIRKWNDIISLWKVIQKDDYYILDMEENLIYIDDEMPGIEGICQVWDPKIGALVDMDILTDTLYVLDKERNYIRKYDLNKLEFKELICKSGNYNGEINRSLGMDIYQNKIYIADTDNDRVQVVDKNCDWISYIGVGKGGFTLNKPEQVYVNDFVFVIDNPLGQGRRLNIFDIEGNPIEDINNYDCVRYNDHGERETDCDFEEVNDLYVTKNKNDYNIYVVFEENIDTFIFKDNRTRDDLLDTIEFVNKIITEAETLYNLSQQTFDTNYDLLFVKDKLNAGTKEYNDKNFGTAEIYLTTAMEWANQTYPENKNQIGQSIETKLDTYEQNLQDIFYEADQQYLVNQLMANYSEAIINYDDYSYSKSMLHILNCENLIEGLQINMTYEPTQINQSELENIEELEETINQIETKNDRYMLNLSLDDDKETLEIIKSYYEAGDADLAEQIIEELTGSLNNHIQVIENHEQLIAQAKTYIDQHYLEFQEMNNTCNADLIKEENDFEQAYETIETDPNKALTLSELAYTSADEKCQQTCLCPIPLLISMAMFGFIFVNRKSKNDETRGE